MKIRLPFVLLLAGFLSAQWSVAQSGAQVHTGGQPPSLEKAISSVKDGDDQAAIGELERLLKEPAVPVGARELLAALYLANDRAQDAWLILQPLVDGPSPDAVVLFNAARSLLALGRAEEAERYLESSVEQAPVSRAALLLAEQREKAGDHDAVVRLLGPMVEGRVGDGLEQDEPAVALSTAWSFARSLLATGEKERAVLPLQRITRLSPADQDAWRMLGELLAELGRADDAYIALSTAQSLAETDRAAEIARAEQGRERLQEAYERRESGDLEGALEALRQTESLTPHNPMPWILEIRLLIDMDRASEALDKAEFLASITREDTEAVYLRGSARLALKDFDGAEKEFRQVLERTPTHRAAMNSLALVLIATDRLEEAESLLAELLASWPDDTVAIESLERLRRLSESVLE